MLAIVQKYGWELMPWEYRQFPCLWSMVVGKKPGYLYSAAYRWLTQTAALHNPGSGSRLAWADDTVARYAAIHCRNSGQVDPRRSTTDIPPPQSAALGLHPVARRLLLINRPRRDGTLSRRWYTAATGGSRTRDLAIAKSSLVPLGHRVPL